MKENRWSRDISIALLLGGLFLVILALVSRDSDESKPEVPSTHKESVRAIDLVNKHLREVYDRQEMERQNVENINIMTAPPLYKTPKTEPVFHFDDLPLSFDQDSINEIIGQDLRIYATTLIRQKPLNQQIQQEIIDDIKRAAEEEVYKKALAEAIIKKAKNKGYDVQVDEDYKVKSVRKVIIKEPPSVFDPNSLPNR